MLNKLAFAFLGCCICAVSWPCLAQDLQRGIHNYQQIISGKKRIEQLTPIEKREVFMIHQRVQAARLQSNGSDQCREARERARDTASDLADDARRLRNCAEAEDYSDDCSSEFSRVRSTHSDYEDAVSSVASECN